MLGQIFLEIALQNWPFKIGLSLLDFKQLLVDSGIIVHCGSNSILKVRFFGTPCIADDLSYLAADVDLPEVENLVILISQVAV